MIKEKKLWLLQSTTILGILDYLSIKVNSSDHSEQDNHNSSTLEVKIPSHT